MRISFHGAARNVTGSKHLISLDNGIKIYDPVKSKFVLQEDVLAKFGVLPNKVREVQALVGGCVR